MFRAVVDHMAALAERAQVAGPRVARVMVEVRGGEHNSGLLEIAVLAVGRPVHLPAPAVPPGLVRLVEPAAVAEMMDDLAMRAAAGFTAPLGADEAHPGRKLRPVDRGNGVPCGSAWRFFPAS